MEGSQRRRPDLKTEVTESSPTDLRKLFPNFSIELYKRDMLTFITTFLDASSTTQEVDPENRNRWRKEKNSLLNGRRIHR